MATFTLSVGLLLRLGICQKKLPDESKLKKWQLGSRDVRHTKGPHHPHHTSACTPLRFHSLYKPLASRLWLGWRRSGLWAGRGPPVLTPQRRLAAHQPSPLSCPRDRRLKSPMWEVGRSPPISVPQILLVKWGGLTRTGWGEGNMAYPRPPKDMHPCLSSEPQKSPRVTQ